MLPTQFSGSTRTGEAINSKRGTFRKRRPKICVDSLFNPYPVFVMCNFQPTSA